MIVKPDLIKRIKDHFNLNIYETKVWLALIGKGVASAGEVAEISGVPRSRTYDVLESLEKQGFALAKIGKPVKYLAVRPEVIIDKLKNNTLRNADDKIKQLSKIKETEEFQELAKLYQTGISPIRREDISISLRGKANILNALRETIANTKKEVIICTDIDDFMSKLRIFKPLLQRSDNERVKVKIALTGDNKNIERVNKLLNIKAKKVDLKGKFFLVDRREILFYLLEQSESEDIAVWLNSEFFCQAMADLFEKAIVQGVEGKK
jgi:sugar-specific transcriptional regulator TrmB